MNSVRATTLLAGVLTLGAVVPASVRAELVLPRPSPAATSKQTIGLTEMTVTYSRPGVKGREIWGGLVPYDKPWRTGANEPTTFTTSDEIQVGGKTLAAGSYSVFTVPAKGGPWKVVFSRQKDLLQGKVPFDPAQYVFELTATPETGLPNQEWLWLGFEDLTANGANLVMRWEKARLAVPITMDVNGRVLASARKEIAAAKADDWRTPLRAATWAFDNGVAQDEAKAWLDQSLKVQKAHGNVALQARWLMKDGKKTEAIAAAKEAIALGKASKDPVDTAPTEKLVAEWTASK